MNKFLSIAMAQLAIDFNCAPEDFTKDSITFCEAKENPGRRPFTRKAHHVDMATMGNGVVISATTDILPTLRKQLNGKSRDEAFTLPFVQGTAIYFLPLSHLAPFSHTGNFTLDIFDQAAIPTLYAHKGFENALGYNETTHGRTYWLWWQSKMTRLLA